MQMKKIAEHIGVHGWSCLLVAPTGTITSLGR